MQHQDTLNPSSRRLSVRLEQMRQARRIHGGLLGLLTAKLAVGLSRIPLPSKRLRTRLFVELYARMYPPGLNASEAERPLGDYRSFNALFTRGLKPGSREISVRGDEILCPCDGTVQEVGRVEDGTVVTAKGIVYSVASLLADLEARGFEGSAFAVIFLSPIDCHRVFSPVAGSLEKAVHVPGARLLVHPPFQRPEFPVYTLNERVVLRLTGEIGPCVVVMVAGWGVGHITLPLAGRYRPRSREVDTHVWSPPQPVARGDWIGTFELGSTVVVIAPPSREMASLVSPNQKVRYGQALFRLAQ
ncbi:MAG: archaetidylserine decarboxylase [Isosphaeraceae bacterium]